MTDDDAVRIIGLLCDAAGLRGCLPFFEVVTKLQNSSVTFRTVEVPVAMFHCSTQLKASRNQLFVNRVVPENGS